LGNSRAPQLERPLAVALAIGQHVVRGRQRRIDTNAGGAKVFEDAKRLPYSWLGLARFSRIAAIVACAAFWATPAAAYRPFDGTDAAVADFGEVEIEFQPIGAIHAGSTKALTDAIVNYGFAERWELVLQSTPQVPPEGSGPLSVSNGVFLKYVLEPGVLQDKKGPSIATEFGPLLPQIGSSKDPTNGRFDQFLKSTPTVSATALKHFRPWPEPFGK
jgi:hypothetical protein